jgi:small subunit ribosomal protein S18
VDKVEHIDYKDVTLLRRFVADTGQMDSRRRTGTCARHQRRLTVAIKRARFLALLPYTAEHIRLHG